MSKFKVGDRVRVNCPNSLTGKHGAETVVTRILGRTTLHYLDGSRQFDEVYVTDLLGSSQGSWCGYPAHELVPIYDGNEKVSWSECVWQPKQVSA